MLPTLTSDPDSKFKLLNALRFSWMIGFQHRFDFYFYILKNVSAREIEPKSVHS